VIIERPAISDDAQAFKGRAITGLPVFEKVGQDGIKLPGGSQGLFR
jgi:hypothetical protein